MLNHKLKIQNRREQNFSFGIQYLVLLITHLLFCIEKTQAAPDIFVTPCQKNTIFEGCFRKSYSIHNNATTFPTAINTNRSECELTTGSGIATFFLTNLDSEITGNTVGVSVSYYLTSTDAQSGTNTISSPYNSVSKTIYARVTDNSTGEYNTATVNLKVLSLPVSTLSGGDTVCGGTPLQLIPHTVYASEATFFSQSWRFLNGSDFKIASIDSNGIITGKTGGTATVLYNVFDSKGCTNFASHVITVTPILKTVTVAGAVCSGDSATIQLSGLSPNFTFDCSYYINNSLKFDIVKNIFSDAGGNTQFKVKVFSINNGSFPSNTQYLTINSIRNAFGCHVAIYKQVGIIVYPLPLPDFTGQTTVCSGNIITLTPSYILPVGTSFNDDYWSSSNTNVAIVNNGIVKGISAGTADISYRVQDSRMCDSTIIKTITVTTSLLPSVNISASTTTICEGTNVIFTATSINGGLNPVYQWQKNGVNAGTNSATFRDNNIGNNDVIFCNLVSNSSGCLTTANAVSNKITMTVIPQPKPTITGIKKSFCENEQELLLTATPGGGTFTVDGTITTAFKPLLLGHGNHSVIYNYTDAAGCSGSEKISVNIDGIIKPEANAGADDISQNGIFVLKANIPALGDSAVWTVLTGVTVYINNIHAPNAIVSRLPDSTKIVLRWTIFHGACVSYSDITIYPAIPTNFFAEKKTDKVLLKWITFYEKDNNYFDIERSQDSFSFTVIGRVKSIGNSTGETQYQFIDDAPPYGKIYYRLKTVDKQSRTSYSRINEIDFLIEKKYFLYPNPFQDYLSFHAAGDLPEDVSIIIFGITGRVLKTLDISLKAGINDKIIHTEELPSGIYFFKILSNVNSKITTYEFRFAKI